MAIYDRGKGEARRWVCDFVIGGQRVNHTLHGCRTKAEAQAAEAKLKAEYKARLNRAGAVVRMTLETAIQRYVVERLKPKAKPAALERYLSALSLLRAYFGPATPVENINRTALADWWATEMGRGIKPGTAKRYLNQLKAVLGFAYEAGSGVAVPTFSPTVPDDSRLRWLTPPEEDRLLAAAPPRLRDLLAFYLDTGARKTEATGLQWWHVDLDRPGRPLVRFLNTKSGKPRGVPVPERTASILRRLRTERPDDAPSDHVFLLPNRGTGPLAPAGDFKKGWNTVRTKARLADVHVHDLRHTFASRLIQRGATLSTVGALLGHSSMKMTMRYAHLAPEGLDAATALLDQQPKVFSEGIPPSLAVGGDGGARQGPTGDLTEALIA